MNASRNLAVVAIIATIFAIHPSSRVRAGEKNDPSVRLLRDASLMLLKEGNTRFSTGKPQHPNQDSDRRTEVAKGQEPFATILACSDSRDPVELIFDRGVGDVFVIRVAGNIAGLSELATVEYGVGHLNTPMLIVMGHTKCGAVTAVAKGAELHGHLHALADKIKPAVEKAKAGTTDSDELVPRAIQANVWQAIEDIIKQSSVVREKLAAGKVSILGAVYDLESGKVTWLGQHPAEDSLIALAAQAETDQSLKPKSDEGHATPVAAEKHSDSQEPAAAPVKKVATHVRQAPPKAPPVAEPHGEEQRHSPAPVKRAPKLAGPGDEH